MNILIIDDNPINLLVLKKTLEALKKTADIANNGVIGLEACLNKKYDVIFLDLVMSGLNGIDVYRILKTREYQAKIYFITASKEDNDLYPLAEKTSCEILIKPILKKKLSEILND